MCVLCLSNLSSGDNNEEYGHHTQFRRFSKSYPGTNSFVCYIFTLLLKPLKAIAAMRRVMFLEPALLLGRFLRLGYILRKELIG